MTAVTTLLLDSISSRFRSIFIGTYTDLFFQDSIVFEIIRNNILLTALKCMEGISTSN